MRGLQQYFREQTTILSNYLFEMNPISKHVLRWSYLKQELKDLACQNLDENLEQSHSHLLCLWQVKNGVMAQKVYSPQFHLEN